MDHTFSADEYFSRWNRCRTLLHEFIPQARGVLVFSRLNIYYFTGSFASGVFWLPLEGAPFLFCRRGDERAKIESPVEHIYPFNSYRDIETILGDHNESFPGVVAAEMNGLSWALANSLTKHLSIEQFVPADKVIGMCRAKKSRGELDILHHAGTKHAKCLTELLPPLLHSGMSELAISHKIFELFFSQGHCGILRMGNYGEEVFLGHISVGDSANYPSVFNGPVGLRGVHPATPYMGSADIIWTEGKPLIVDNGFNLAGYITDKTQVYGLGDRNSLPENAVRAHEFCIGLQDEIAGLLRPGAIPSEIWSKAQAKADRAGWSDGFMGDGKNKVFFVGHGIGLAIDEYPVLAKGFDLPLEEGMTIAVEPKIGIGGIGMVGVENTFAVTTAGGKSLTGEEYDIIIV
ncbi:MAG: M24 family metallopeptidase [Desulfobulbales bacterium]|nr:M24 family metallopeptidase [Desulfobulbales bacterium]